MEININDKINAVLESNNQDTNSPIQIYQDYKNLKYPIQDNETPECLVLKYEYLNGYIASGYTNGNIIIHNLSKNTNILFKYSSASITSLRWKPHNLTISKNILLTIDSEGNIVYWHTTSGKVLHKLEEKGIALLSLDYTMDGSIFAIGCDDKSIRIYDENMKIAINSIGHGSNFKKGHTSRVNSICFEQGSSNVLFSGGWDGKVLLHDIRENSINTNEIVTGAYINGDTLDVKENVLLVGGRKEVMLYDLRNVSKAFQTISNETTTVYTAQFHKVKNYFAYGGAQKNILNMFEYKEDGRINAVIQNMLLKQVYTLDFSYDGSYLAYSGGDPNVKIIKLNN
jgi:COMPASS component SWD3